ncbi:hypothetical protein EUGRSUZ_H00924 [Eucalyptus grandis]|uniref:Uncharacterized protein n=2 Tax=Eucalyptus grandis TaxID=71139 RepID=A0ACC3KBK3_EUCGR|nr:hypothetical protein EUGRSUZ_H00924 [Eucalyptus grandis]
MDMGLSEHPRQRETSSPSSSRRPLLLLAIARDRARVLSCLRLLHLLLVKLPHHVHLREARARLINPRARHLFPLPYEPEKLGFLPVAMSDGGDAANYAGHGDKGAVYVER